MSLRHAVRSLGLSARPLLNRSTPTRAPSYFNAALSARLQPIRLSWAFYSSDASNSDAFPPLLSPPWTMESLNAVERHMYEKYGNDALKHVADDVAQMLLRNIVARQKASGYLAESLGENWGEIVAEGNKRRDEFQARYEEALKAQGREIRTRDRNERRENRRIRNEMQHEWYLEIKEELGK